jgi:prevent-host-death family protein
MKKSSHRWQLQAAKARLSEVVKCAQRDGPQEITVRGEAAAVVLSVADYQRVVGAKPSLIEFLRASPLHGIELDLERDTSAPRATEL